MDELGMTNGEVAIDSLYPGAGVGDAQVLKSAAVSVKISTPVTAAEASGTDGSADRVVIDGCEDGGAVLGRGPLHGAVEVKLGDVGGGKLHHASAFKNCCTVKVYSIRDDVSKIALKRKIRKGGL